MTPPHPKVVAIVPMKGHSARVPRKNIRPLAGRPLYHWIVDALGRAPEIDRVVVETDSDEIAADAAANFDVTVLRRPPSLVGDEVPMNDLIAFHMSQLRAPCYLQTHSTNPLLRSETISHAIQAYFAPGDHDSLFAVTALRTRLFRADGSALNHNPDELIPTQDLAPVYEENSNLYLFTEESFALRRHRIGKKPLLFPVDRLEAVDIDEEPDFRFAEFLMRERLGHGSDKRAASL